MPQEHIQERLNLGWGTDIFQGNLPIMLSQNGLCDSRMHFIARKN